MNKILLLLVAVSLSLLVACGPSTKVETLESGDMTFVLSGPLFAGPNTAQVTFQADLTALGTSADKIEGARLLTATFSSADSIPFQGWEGVVVQFVSDVSPMVNAAVMNPIEANGNEIVLEGSKEADLKDLFRDGTFFIVTDINLTDDVMDDLTFTGSFTFELDVAE